MKNTRNLLRIMACLRHPEQGCSWDRKQSFASLIPHTLEEAYEVVDAIEREDYSDLQDELGDLLLQVVFHSRLAEEEGLFDFESVAQTICEKLTRRHPHVFGDARFDSDAERIKAWEAVKTAERGTKKKTVDNPGSILDGIAANLPALMHAAKIQTRASRHGFDWPGPTPVFDKIEEELAEVREAVESDDQQQIRDEIGDLLFVVVNLARHLKVEPETALREGSRKFSRRFRQSDSAYT